MPGPRHPAATQLGEGAASNKRTLVREPVAMSSPPGENEADEIVLSARKGCDFPSDSEVQHFGDPVNPPTQLFACPSGANARTGVIHVAWMLNNSSLWHWCQGNATRSRAGPVGRPGECDLQQGARESKVVRLQCSMGEVDVGGVKSLACGHLVLLRERGVGIRPLGQSQVLGCQLANDLCLPRLPEIKPGGERGDDRHDRAGALDERSRRSMPRIRTTDRPLSSNARSACISAADW